MKHECQQLIESYIDWLRKGLAVEDIEGACELTTPFLDRHNDHLQVYAVRRNGAIVLSDDGYILSDLRTSGMDINTAKRKAVLDTALRGFGVRIEGDQLTVEASEKNLGQRIHSLIQAMLTVNDMFVLARSRVESFFLEDVRAFLDEHDIRYSARVKLSGRTGFDHAIDFLIPHSKSRPERIVQAINMPNRNSITSFIFSLSDTREARNLSVEAQESAPEAYAFLNDKDHGIGGDVLEALDAYHVKPAFWSHREEYVEALAG